jgi:hypothetical protein
VMALPQVVLIVALLALACVLVVVVSSHQRARWRGGQSDRLGEPARRGEGAGADQVDSRDDGADRSTVRPEGAKDGARERIAWPAERVDRRAWRGAVEDRRAWRGAGVDRRAWRGAGGVDRRAWRGDRADRRALRRLDRKINQLPGMDRLTADRRLPPVEQIAAELRRLDRHRRVGPSNGSAKWSAAVATAYDAWLLAACRRLDISEHLTTLVGIDRDIERVRVEGELETAGLVLRSGTNGWW